MIVDKDPYKVLGVSRSASKEEIHKAFRSLAAKYHPDRNPDDKEASSIMFKEASAAFEILGDDEKRRRYDTYRDGFPSFSFRSRNSVDEIFNNMFSHFFGDQRPSGSRIRLKVTLEEAYFGCQKKVDVEKHEFCSSCKGSGSSSWEQCDRCSGKGCIKCSGRGSSPKDKCKSCSGNGYLVAGSSQIDVNIPPGVDNGFQIRIPESGSSGDDLFVMISVERHGQLERNDHFLLGRVNVSYPKLFFGGFEEFDLFGAKISLRIPPRSAPGLRLKVKGKGMPFIQNPEIRGDLILELRLKMPENTTKEYEDLLSLLMKMES